MSDQILLGELVHRQNSVNKPGTACLGCRRRKLKCDRSNEGCHNCSKSSLQCVYPAPDVGVKRKRGPYKKDKTPRERHLEDLVKYLKPDVPSSGHDAGNSERASSYDEATPDPNRSISAPSATQAANSESLVTDALIALTRSSVADHTARDDSGSSSMHKYVSSGVHGTAASQHPNVRRIFEYWHIFVARVDPIVKVIHCPTFAKKLFGVIDNIGNIAPSTNALLFCIYYSALGSCTAREVRQRFGESREELMLRYGRHFESAVGHSFDVPSLESLQSLVLYMIANHRYAGGSIKHFFHVAVRSAQMIRLNEDPGSSFSPLEAELRRRLWYHLCGLESRSAEESTSRTPNSVLHNHTVRMPANLNDWDIAPGMSKAPQARTGVTEVTFVILRFEIHSLVFGLVETKKKWAKFEPSKLMGHTRKEQAERLELTQTRLENDYMRHLDLSRPYDWMCSQYTRSMLIKARLMVEFPSGTVPSKTMLIRDRMYLLQSSVDIIQATHNLSTDDRISDAQWFFRGYIQWHCLAVVVAELGWNANQGFLNSAWAVLDPMLSDWDTIYKSKRDDPAWDHVNFLIERARSLKPQRKVLAAKKTIAEKGRVPSSVDVLLDRAASKDASTGTTFPIRGSIATTSAEHTYVTQATDSEHLQQESWAPQEQCHFQQPLESQYLTATIPAIDPYGSMGATASFDIDYGSGFDDINFAAFNEVFSSQSWNHLDHVENHNSLPLGTYLPVPDVHTHCRDDGSI